MDARALAGPLTVMLSDSSSFGGRDWCMFEYFSVQVPPCRHPMVIQIQTYILEDMLGLQFTIMRSTCIHLHDVENLVVYLPNTNVFACSPIPLFIVHCSSFMWPWA
jgi:hypothetical protein